jgi:hypothetical protein
MLSRRTAIVLPWLAASARIATAQPTPSQALGGAIFAADNQPGSLLLAQTLLARIGARDFHAESSQGINNGITHLIKRDQNNLAILPSTALAFMDRQGSQIVGSIRFIACVSVMEIHVLAAQRTGSMAELAGRRVNVGPMGSQGQVTASLLLERAALRIEPVYAADDVALASLIHGQLAAMIFLATKPSKLLFSVNLADGVHFLPMFEAISSGRPTGGFATQINPADYPLLSGGEAGAGQPIPTIAVPLVLASYDWPAVSNQFMAFARVADLLSQRGSGLPGFSMTATVPGWRRFGPVEDWLKRGGSISDVAAAAQHAALFREFLDWQKHRK